MKKLNVMFRENTLNQIEMVYIGDHNEIVSFTQQEGHNTAVYEYITEDTTPFTDYDDVRVKNLINYYATSPEPIECVIVKNIFDSND